MSDLLTEDEVTDIQSRLHRLCPHNVEIDDALIAIEKHISAAAAEITRLRAELEDGKLAGFVKDSDAHLALQRLRSSLENPSEEMVEAVARRVADTFRELQVKSWHHDTARAALSAAAGYLTPPAKESSRTASPPDASPNTPQSQE